MKLVFEQLFYGRGARGYDVLGASPGGVTFATRVEALCGAIGTPETAYDGTPFLLSVPEGDHVLMICGRRGASDSMGRETLFFHALVAAKKDLAATKADAFSLFAQGVFAAKMPGPVESLQVDCKPGRDGSTSHPPDGRAVGAPLPCFVRSPRPAPDVVRALVGGRANDLAWVTFAFQPMSGFDVQVLPPRIAAPRFANECDTDGKLVRTAETPSGARSPTGPSDGFSHSSRSVSEPEHDNALKHRPSNLPKSSAMLKTSLFANLALAVVCAALFAARKPVPIPPDPPHLLVDADVVPKADYDLVVHELESVKTERDEALRKAESEQRTAEINRNILESIIEQAKTIPGNLQDLPGFNGFATWKDSSPKSESRKSFEAFQSITNLINIIKNQPTEKTKP